MPLCIGFYKCQWLKVAIVLLKFYSFLVILSHYVSNEWVLTPPTMIVGWSISPFSPVSFLFMVFKLYYVHSQVGLLSSSLIATCIF